MDPQKEEGRRLGLYHLNSIRRRIPGKGSKQEQLLNYNHLKEPQEIISIPNNPNEPLPIMEPPMESPTLPIKYFPSKREMLVLISGRIQIPTG